MIIGIITTAWNWGAHRILENGITSDWSGRLSAMLRGRRNGAGITNPCAHSGHRNCITSSDSKIILSRSACAAATRPLFDYPIRDTSVCVGHDGAYYLTGTTGAPDWWAVTSDIQVWRSEDLQHWKPVSSKPRERSLVWNGDREGTWEKRIPSAMVCPFVRCGHRKSRLSKTRTGSAIPFRSGWAAVYSRAPVANPKALKKRCSRMRPWSTPSTSRSSPTTTGKFI